MFDFVMNNRVCELRKKAGLTQTELGFLSGLSQNSISSLEVGQYSPRAFNALKICQALGCKLEDCFYLELENVPDK